MKKKAIIGLLLVCIAIYCIMHTIKQKQSGFDDKTDVTYVGTNLELDKIEGRICSYKQNNGQVYLLTEQKKDGLTEGGKAFLYQIYQLNSEENNQPSVSFENSGKVIDFCVDETGSIIYISEDNNGEVPEVNLVKIDSQGTELAKQNIDAVIQNKNIYLCGIMTDRNGQIVLACREGIYFLDESLQVNEKMVPQSGDDVIEIAQAKTGEIVCVTDRLNSDEVAIKVHLLDPVKKSWGDTLSIRLDMAVQNDYIIEGYEYDFYYKANSGIYGYDLATKEKRRSSIMMLLI